MEYLYIYRNKEYMDSETKEFSEQPIEKSYLYLDFLNCQDDDEAMRCVAFEFLDEYRPDLEGIEKINKETLKREFNKHNNSKDPYTQILAVVNRDKKEFIYLTDIRDDKLILKIGKIAGALTE